MNKPTIRYFKAEDILHIAIAGGPESRSIELSPTITVEDEYLAYMNYKAGQEEKAARFALLRDATGQNAAYNQLSEEEGLRLAEEAREEIARQS